MMVISTLPTVSAQQDGASITASLTDITSTVGSISPEFNADTLYYKIELANLDTMPEIGATAPEGYTTAVEQPSAVNQYVSGITVTNNSDSSDTKTYYVRLVPTDGERIVSVIPVSALSTESADGYDIAEAVDPHPNSVGTTDGKAADTIWQSMTPAADGYAYFTVDLGRVMDVTKANFHCDSSVQSNITLLYVSNDGINFTEVTLENQPTKSSDIRDDIYGMGGRSVRWKFDSPIEARYIRVQHNTAGKAIRMAYVTVYARTFVNAPALESMTIDKGTLSPAFSPDVYDYTVEVDDLSILPEISAAAPAGYTAAVTQMSASNNYADNYVARVKVTSNDASFDEKIYTVRALSTEHNAMLPITYMESGCSAIYNDDYASYEGGIDLSNVTTSYISKSGENGSYTVDLGRIAKVGLLRYNQRINQSLTSYSSWGDTNAASVAAFEKIEISNDGEIFTDVTEKATRSTALGSDNIYKLPFYQISFSFSEQLQARYIRVSNDDAKSLWINGTEVFGKLIYQVFLETLSVDKGTLSPAFDKAVFDYEILMDNFDDVPIISSSPEVGIEIIETVQPAAENGYVGTVSLRNTENGRKNTYTLCVIYPDVEENINITGYEEGSSEGFAGDISYGIDGSNEENEWTSGESLKPQFAIELGQTSNITKVRFYQKTSSDSLERVSVSADGISFTDVTEFAEITNLGNNASLNKWNKEYYATEFAFSTPITAKYVRVENNSGDVIKLCGSSVYGYTKKIAAPKLKSISVDSGEIAPAFGKNVYLYNLTADDMDNLPTITAEKEYPDSEALRLVLPTSQNGYKWKALLSSSRGATPYVVNMYENMGMPLEAVSYLQDISLSTDGGAYVSLEGFDKDILTYTYTIAKRNNLPKVRATCVYDGATVAVVQATSEKPYATISVTSQSGANTSVYTVNFVYVQKITQEALITREIVPYYDLCTQSYKGESFETAIDGGDGYSNSWEALSGEETMYTIDLGMVTDVTKIIYWQNTGSTGRGRYEDLEISTDGINFVNATATGIATRRNLGWIDHSVWGERFDGIQYSFSSPTEARYIKIGNDDKAGIKINGIDVYENIYPAYLETLNVNIGTMSPQFSSTVFEYSAEVESFDTLPILSASPKDSSEIIETVQPSAENGYIGSVKVYDDESGKTNTYTVSVLFPDAELNLHITGYEEGSSIGYKGTLEAGIDGSDKETSWSSSSALKPRFAVALDKLSNITRVKYYQDTGETIQSHFERISVSRDGTTFVDVTEFLTRTDSGWDEGENIWGHNYYVTTFEFPTPITAKYIRVENNSGDILNIKGTQVYGYNEKIVAPTLKNISLNLGELIPSFSKDVYSYEVLLEDIEKLPRIVAETEFLNTEKTTVIKPTKENNNVGKILLESNRGATVYIVKMYEDRGIALEDMTELSSISLSFDGINYTLLEDFDREESSYAYPIRSTQTIPNVRAVAAYDGATVVIEQATEENPVARIIVTSASQDETDVYMVGFMYNIALNQPSWSSSGTSEGGVDGDLTTRWKTNTAAAGGGYFAVSLGSLSRIYAMTLYSQLSNPAYFDQLYVSKDGQNFEKLDGVTVLRTGNVTNVAGINLYEFEYELPSEYMDVWAVKVRGQDEYKIKSEIYELEVYGEKISLVSGDSLLETLTLDSGAIEDFSSYKQSYTVTIGALAPIPQITAAVPKSDTATVDIVQATVENPTATVTVTAQNAVSKTTYTISFVREVQPEDNNYLSSLTVKKGKMVPEFSKAVNTYTVYIEETDGILTKSDVSAAAETSGAALTVSEDGKTVTITSQNGADNIYSITPVYSSSKLTALSAAGYTLSPQFAPGITNYTVALSDGDAIPKINVADGEKLILAQCSENAAMQIKEATADYPMSVITITDETGYLKSTYTITYVTKQSLTEAQAAVLEKLSQISVSNNTDLSTLAGEITSVITNSDINAIYETPLSRTLATSTADGKISGSLKLSYGGNNVYVKINLVIAKTGGTGGSTDTGGGGGGGGGGGASFPSTTFPDSIVENENTNQETNIADTITREAQAAIAGHWAEKEATVLAQKGIVKGKDGSYALEDNVTRAEFIAMLVRVFELDELPYSGGFADVSGNEWYAGVISAAHSQGLLNGSGGKAHPNNNITREESVKLLVCFIEKYNGQIESTETATFEDSEAISEWAEEYVSKAVSGGFINGMGNNEFMPKGTLTRAQAMVMLYRVIFDA